MNDIKIAIVAVTYACRADLLNRALAPAAASPNVKAIIVVDNGSSPPYDRKINPAFCHKVHLIRQPLNTGSAGGYQIGIKEARNIRGIDFIVLIDDDLVIDNDTIDGLQGMVDDLPKSTVIVLPRDDRPEQRLILSGKRRNFIRKNSFHDFHVLPDKNRIAIRENMNIKVDHAPYAGLAIPVGVALNSELPDDSFFVYCDDYDYVRKLLECCTSVQLVDASPLRSLDKSWNQKKLKAPAAFDITAPPFRVYYSVRNRVAYERRYIVNFLPVYAINLIVYMLAGGLVSYFEQRKARLLWQRLRLICRAIADGFSGQLGQVPSSRYERSC